MIFLKIPETSSRFKNQNFWYSVSYFLPFSDTETFCHSMTLKNVSVFSVRSKRLWFYSVLKKLFSVIWSPVGSFIINLTLINYSSSLIIHVTLTSLRDHWKCCQIYFDLWISARTSLLHTKKTTGIKVFLEIRVFAWSFKCFVIGLSKTIFIDWIKSLFIKK